MIRDHLDGLSDRPHDVCIVGAGPVGLSLALELDQLGLSSLVIESGGARHEARCQDLSAAELVNPALHDDMRIAVARRLGGTSNLWGGRCLPYDPIDFLARPGMPDWPIGLDDITPFLPAACHWASCGGPVFRQAMQGPGLNEEAFSFTQIERWSARPRFQVAHARDLATSPRIDIRLHTSVVDVLFDEAGAASALVVVRPDGDRHVIRARRFVIAAGGLETTRLLLNLQRKAPARFGGPDGPLGRYYMGHIIGEISDLTLSTARLDQACDFHVDRYASYVRRRFVPSEATQLRHDLLNISFWPTVPRIADAAHGCGFLSLAYLALSVGPLGRLLIPDAIRKRHVSPASQRHAHLTNALRNLPSSAAAASWFVWKRYGAARRLPGLFVRNPRRRYGLSYHAEQSPRADSRVSLGAATDATGLPRLQIDYRVHRDDARSIVRAHEQLATWLERTGAGTLEYRQPAQDHVEAVMNQAGHGTHQIGTARMAASPRSGIVDRDLRTFDVPNLYLATAAVLPRSGQANPTLTVIALAVRLAHHIAQQDADQRTVSLQTAFVPAKVA